MWIIDINNVCMWESEKCINNVRNEWKKEWMNVWKCRSSEGWMNVGVNERMNVRKNKCVDRDMWLEKRCLADTEINMYVIMM